MKFLEDHLPKIMLAPSFVAVLVFVYGFIAWTAWVSLTKSKLLPKYDIEGFLQYDRLFASLRWDTAFSNLFLFGALFIGISMVLGLVLAIFLDQNIRTEGAIRTIYLYPMALSMIVTGTAWKWILNPGLGLEAMVRGWGFENFTFDWLVNPDMAIYTVVIAAIWQSSGFVMALFLAGLRSVDGEIIKAAQIDGIPSWRIYSAIIIPAMAPIFLSAFIVLAHLAIKSFDLVIALTGGGPGFATDLPATYMFAMAFSRGDIGQAASSAMVMMMVVFAIVVPYLYS
ncbi:MAG: carbohydrate ABC transporter permease, partial [Cognatishimia activa]